MTASVGLFLPESVLRPPPAEQASAAICRSVTIS
jgi:hypothetical protein